MQTATSHASGDAEHRSRKRGAAALATCTCARGACVDASPRRLAVRCAARLHAHGRACAAAGERLTCCLLLVRGYQLSLALARSSRSRPLEAVACSAGKACTPTA